MAKNIIYYFTGTGNSLAAAKLIARRLGDCEVVFMKGAFTPAAHYERMGFVLPCYAGGAPKAALQFLKNMPLTGDSADYVFSVTTCNDSGGDASFMLDKSRNEAAPAASVFHGVLWHRKPVLPCEGAANESFRRLHGLRPLRPALPGGKHRHESRQATVFA